MTVKKRSFIRVIAATFLSALLSVGGMMSLTAAASPEEVDVAETAYYVLNPNGAIIYDAPDIEANRIGRIDADEIIYAAQDAVSYGGSGEAMLRFGEGRYVALRDVREWAEEYELSEGLAFVTADRTHVLAEPGSDTQVIGTLDEKAAVAYYGVYRGYLQIYHNGHTGWIDEKDTNRGKMYENRKPVLFEEEFLSAPVLGFFDSDDGAAGAEHGTPVYLYPEEDPAFLFGYLNGGLYAVQETVSGSFYKIEYRGEAVFVPVRFQKSEEKTVAELSVNDWPGSPLSGSVMDRFYVTTEEVQVYAFNDRAKPVSTLKKGAIVQGSADTDAGYKTVMNPIDLGSPYAVVSSAYLKPVRPTDLVFPPGDPAGTAETEEKHTTSPAAESVAEKKEHAVDSPIIWPYLAGAGALVLIIVFFILVRLPKKNESAAAGKETGGSGEEIEDEDRNGSNESEGV